MAGRLKPAKEPESEQAAFAYAIWLLGRREYAAAEMRERLRNKGYIPAVVESTMERLIGGDYLSDARFAESFVRMRVARGDTPRLAALKARQRGVSEALVTDVCQESLAGYDAHAVCEKIIAKRDPDGTRFADRKVWNRHFRYLKSKGFDSAVVLDVLNSDHNAED